MISVSNSSVPPNMPATRSINSRTASRPPFSRVSANTGTKACAKAPSANSRRKKFGILNATKNASALPLAPIKLASITSRNRPKMRESMVAPPTTALERTNLESSATVSDTLSHRSHDALRRHRPKPIALLNDPRGAPTIARLSGCGHC